MLRHNCHVTIFALTEYAELCSNHSTQQLTEQQYKSGEKKKGIVSNNGPCQIRYQYT